MAKELDMLRQELAHIQRKFSDIEQAYQELQTKFQQIDTLYNISASFGAIIDLEHLLKRISRIFRHQIRVDRYALFSYDHTEQRVTSLYASGSKEENGKTDALVTPGFFKRTIRQNKTLYVPDVSKVGRTGFGKSSRGSLVCLPLVTDTDPIAGFLILQRDGPDAFGASDITMLEELSEHLAFALNKTLLYEHTKELSITDELTGIYNRRHFMQRFEFEVQRSKRYNRSVSLMMLDIDHFKHYNDLNGHLKGDLILIRVAAILNAELRKADIVARYGGEEFIVLLPETTCAQALNVASKLRRKIQNEKFELAEKQPGGKITASFGIAVCPDDACDPKTLIHLADKALYSAKSHGRNRVASHSLPDQAAAPA
jgi:diguanylate cyclase (GGDEF)-like protein